MSVIIRLQNLPWSANALDIRQFFHGLSIPEGGVHIVGGEQGDAFIAFSTDEDARQAFSRNSGKIKEVQISLMLSSRTEMQKVIEAARAQSYAAFMPTPPMTQPLPAAVPQIIPAAVPDIRSANSKERDNNSTTGSNSGKRDRKRSRTRSRDRTKDRRRYRDRSRSRSRERRRDRRRGDRSRSRNRTRSRDRDRKNRDRKQRSPDVQIISTTPAMPKKAPVPPPPQPPKKVPPAEVWMTPAVASAGGDPLPPQNQNMLNAFMANFEDARRNLSSLQNQPDNNGGGGGGGPGLRASNFQPPALPMANRMRESWPPQGGENGNNGGFLNRSDNSLGGRQMGPGMGLGGGGGGGGGGQFPPQGRRFQRNNFQGDAQERGGGDREPASQCCVKLEPFYGGYGDIRRFFHGSFISNVGIKFINDEFGHRTGMVYVQFGHPHGKAEAMRKSGESLNGVDVEIVHLDDQEFEEAVDRFQPTNNFSPPEMDVDSKPPPPQSTKYRKNITKYFHNNKQEPPGNELKIFQSLIVDDLPTYVKEQDILKMFSNRPLLSLILTMKPRGGHIAYVKFGSTEEAKKALDDTSMHSVGGKPVTVRPCQDAEFEAINQQHEVDLDIKPSPRPIELDTDCLNITLLPLHTNMIEITDFFSDIGVRPAKIHLMNNRMGFTGQAFCEFDSKADAAEALKKDNASFGPNVVKVEPMSREEMEMTISGAPQQIIPGNGPSGSPGMPNMPMGGQQPQRPMMMMPQNNRPPFFGPRGGFDGGPRGPPRPPFMGGGEGGRGGGGGGGGPGVPRARQSRFMNASPNDDLAPPGFTVFMDNVPYKAGTNEILDFFEGYDITNNVSRRFNPNNTPSAEAKVIFNSPDEAFRAVQEKNGQKIWERPIYLKQV